MNKKSISLAVLAATPILMMFGLKTCSAANTSLLNNFEIVATVIIALLFLREAVGRRLWMAINLVTIASILLLLEGSSISDTFTFSRGSLLVLGATVCWGLENNIIDKRIIISIFAAIINIVQYI